MFGEHQTSFKKNGKIFLNVGDVVMVKTKRGNAPIEITRIEKLTECPVDIPVKKVVKKNQ